MKCWRCGKRLEKWQAEKLYLISGITVYVCRDDRICYDTTTKEWIMKNELNKRSKKLAKSNK